MRNLSIKGIESIIRSIFPEDDVQSLGNGLYKINSIGVICNDEFLYKLNNAIIHDLKEYNTDKSAEHPVNI